MAADIGDRLRNKQATKGEAIKNKSWEYLTSFITILMELYI